jgi:hypothetical protein
MEHLLNAVSPRSFHPACPETHPWTHANLLPTAYCLLPTAFQNRSSAGTIVSAAINDKMMRPNTITWAYGRLPAMGETCERKYLDII